MRSVVLSIAALLLCAASSPADLVRDMSIGNQGGIDIGPIRIAVLHFGPGWDAASQQVAADEGFPRQSDEAFELRGQFNTAAGRQFQYEQAMQRQGRDAFAIRVAMQSADTVPTNSLSLSLTLPIEALGGKEILLDEQAVALPRDYGQTQVHSRQGVKRIIIPAPTGKLIIEGDLNVHIQDDREWGSGHYSMRLAFNPGSGEITQARFAATIRHEPWSATPVNIARQANMGFADDVADDRQGGWTDQGPENDLRMLETGDRVLGNVPWRIIDPQRNDGRSALVFAGAQRDYFIKQATVPADGEHRYLYLLHGSAWTPSDEPVGTVHAEYADGSTQAIEVRAGRDVGDWWAPTALPNGAVAWTAENRSAYVGLYASKFPLQGKPLRSLRLEGSGRAVWMVVAMSLSNDDIPLPAESPRYIIADSNWKPLQQHEDVEPGGILDFSFLLDAPAGRHGHIVINGPNFEFENRPGVPVRFYGSNLCFSANFPDHATAELIAERFARLGYNTIRLHHYDHDLLDHSADDSVTLHPEQLDRFCYLIHALKQRGIYISIDLYTFREARPHEIPELNRPVRDVYKTAVIILDSAMENWQTFARRVLTHRNPYTGMTLAEDPVLIGICPLNEDPISTHWGAPDLRRIYDERFEQWLEEHGHRPANEAERQVLLTRFIMQVQRDANARMFAFLKELGVRAPLTGVNAVSAVSMTPVRADLEYVDNHAYWDHPGFPERPWSLPHSYRNRSVVADAASVPRGMMPTRIIDKPFTVTEINYCPPNQYRAEGGVVLGAYAALQDWDGIWRFAESHNRNNMMQIEPMRGFDLATDPLSRLSERIAVLMFLRGDISPSPTLIPYLVTDDTAYTTPPPGWSGDSFPTAFQLIGLHAGIGSVYVDDAADAPRLPHFVASPLLDASRTAARVHPVNGDLAQSLASAGLIDPGKVDLQRRRITSDTGQIELRADEGAMRVVSPRTESFVLPDGMDLDGERVSVRNYRGFGVVSVSAMDDQPIATSRRLLITHLTDLQNTRTRYRNQAMTVLEQWGELPHLVRAGSADVHLHHDAPDGARAYALDVSGRRVGEAELRREGNLLILHVDTHRGEDACMLYEINWAD